MVRNPGWAAAALIAAALTVTACGPATSYSGSSGSGGGAYTSPTATSSRSASSGNGYGTSNGNGYGTGTGTGSGSGNAAGTAAMLKAEATKAGMVLASPKGLTLYYYSGDKPGSGRSSCTGACASAWPPLVAPVRAPSGAHMPGPLGFITRPDGTKQVTLNGYPLYRYADDMSPRQVTGNGAEGEWHVIKLHAAATRTLKVARTTAGTVLASPKGLTLYYYTGDKPGSGRSSCTGACADAWPPLVAPVRAPAGVHLPGKLGFITRPNGTKQVTLNGYPLYRYGDDTRPGQAKGNGEGGEWHVIKVS